MDTNNTDPVRWEPSRDLIDSVAFAISGTLPTTTKAREIAKLVIDIVRDSIASAPPSAPVGVDFTAVSSILRRAMRDGTHYGYRRDFILQQALALEVLSQQPAAVGMTKRELFTIAAMHTLRAGDYAKWEHLAQDAVSLADATLATLAAEQQG